MDGVTFRAGVVAVVQNSNGLVLAFERTDHPGSWQLPQGGLDVGESPTECAWRELEEETGLTSEQVELVRAGDEWIVYEWPTAIDLPDGLERRGRLGQAQQWFFFQVLDDATEPTPDGIEFGDWQWVSVDWLVDHVVAFRRPAYERGLRARND